MSVSTTCVNPCGCWLSPVPITPMTDQVFLKVTRPPFIHSYPFHFQNLCNEATCKLATMYSSVVKSADRIAGEAGAEFLSKPPAPELGIQSHATQKRCSETLHTIFSIHLGVEPHFHWLQPCVFDLVGYAVYSWAAPAHFGNLGHDFHLKISMRDLPRLCQL